MNRGFTGILSLLIVTIIIAVIVYSKSSKQSSYANKFYEFIPANFTTQLVEISNPNDFLENLFNSNLVWKEVSSQFTEFKSFWNNLDSTFIKIKNSAEKLYLFEHEESKYYLFMLPFNVDSLNIPFTFSKGNFLLYSKKGLKKFKKSFEEEMPLYEAKSFKSILSQKTKTSDSRVKFYLKKSNKWNLYELNFLPEQVFASGNIAKGEEKKSFSGYFDELFFEYIPAQFHSLIINQFDTIPNQHKSYEHTKILGKECECDASYSLYGWMSSPQAILLSKQDSFPIFMIKIGDLSEYGEGLRSIIPDSLGFETKNRTVFNIGQEIKLWHLKSGFQYVIRIDEYVYFANNREQLERLNFRIFSNLTLKESGDLYSFIKNNLNKKSYLVELNKGLDISAMKLNNGVTLYQESNQNSSFNYSSFIYSKEIEIGKGIINPKWTKGFLSSFSDNIYTIKNHRTNDINYLIQDNENVLYFISPNGEILWKRNVNNPIIGEIKNIDFLGNSKKQLIFNTKNELYILDVLGRNVEDFPVKIKDSATGNVSILDYDNDLNFRFLVPTKVGIKNINKKGIIVKGWNRPVTKSMVESSISHMVINELDYILARDNQHRLYFYNRKGEERHSVEARFGTPFYLLHGSTIKNTRALFLDTNENTICRQFFDDKPVSILLSPQEKIKQFFFVDVNQDNEREFVLVFNTEIVVYGQDLIIIKKISLPSSYENLKIWERGYSYINEFNELIVVIDDKKQIIEKVESYHIDTYKNRHRVIAKFDKELKMLYIN